MNRKENKFIAIFTDSEKGMLHIENTYTNKKNFENDLKQVGYKKIRIFAESEIKEIIEKYWSTEMPEKYIKTKYDCKVIEYIYEIFKDTTEEAEEQEQAEEQAKDQEQEQEQEKILFVPSDFLVKPEYKIDILEALKEAGYNSGYIRKNKIFPESTVQKFRTGNTDVSMNTIFRVCQILRKDISEVIRFRKE